MSAVRLPGGPGWAELDARFRRAPEAWTGAAVELCARHGLAGAAPLVPFADGSNLVAAAGDRWVVKLFPPFHRHQWESERRVLPRFHGLLPVRVPGLVAEGELEDGWGYVILTRLPGESLETVWPRLTRVERVGLLARIGEVMAAAHALPVGDLSTLPPRWDGFLEEQRARCHARHARLGAPEWFLRGLEPLLGAALPWLSAQPPTALLTGEYSPFNLLVEQDSLEALGRLVWPGPAAAE